MDSDSESNSSNHASEDEIDREFVRFLSGGRNNRATEEQKQEAIQAIKDGKTIAAAARQVGFSRNTVDRWWKAENGEVPPPKGMSLAAALTALTRGSGEAAAAEASAPKRPRGTTPEQDKALAKFVKKNPGMPIQMAISASGFPGSVQTAMKRLQEARVKYVGPKEMQRRNHRANIKSYLFMNALARRDVDTLKFVNRMK